MSGSTIPDEDLIAWLDGRMEAAPARELAARIDRDPALQQRVDALRVDVRAIRAAFDGLADHAPPLPLAMRAVARTKPPDPTLRTMLVGLGLGAGFTVAMALALLAILPDRKGAWQDYLASYQALYVPRTLSHLSPDRADQAAELAGVAAAIGKDIALDALTASPDLDYKRAQILGFEGRPLVQLAFLSRIGAPLALCIIRDDGAGAPLSTGTMEGMSMARWSRGGHAYMLIGGTDDALVEAAAREFAERI